MVTLLHYIILSTIVFLIGTFGIFMNRKSIISLIMSIEIILLSVSINFITFSSYWSNFKGQIFVLFILTISAAEIAVALAALVVYYNNKSNIWADDLTTLKG